MGSRVCTDEPIRGWMPKPSFGSSPMIRRQMQRFGRRQHDKLFQSTAWLSGAWLHVQRAKDQSRRIVPGR